MVGCQAPENVPTKVIQGRWLEAASGFSFSSLGTLMLGLKSSSEEVDEQVKTKDVNNGGT